MEKLSYREVKKTDFETICGFPENPQELFFMFPKAEFPLTVNQLETAVDNRFNSTVVLYDEEVAGFANFYAVKEKEYCSIGNVIVNPKFRNKGIGKFLIKTLESIGTDKYKVSEFRLSCFNTNTKGILLYSKLGYMPYEIEQWTDKQDEVIALIEMKKKV